jgi:hypothetical protein
MSNLSKGTVCGIINWGLMIIGLVAACIYFSGIFKSSTQADLTPSQEKASAKQPETNTTISKNQPAAVPATQGRSPLTETPQTSNVPTTNAQTQTTAAIPRPGVRLTTPANRSQQTRSAPTPPPPLDNGAFPEGF